MLKGVIVIFLATLGVFLGFRLVSAAPIAEATTGTVCKDYYLLNARDQYEPPATSAAFASVINQTLASVPNGGALDVIYPADPSLAGAHMAVAWVDQFVTRRLKECPDRPLRIALLGYGWGGNAASYAAAQLAMEGGPHASAVQAVLLEGSLMHTPRRQGNVDEHGGDSTLATRGAAASDNPPILDTFAQRGALMDICATGDPFCDFGNTNISAHSTYTAKETVDLATAFLIKHLSP